jgi:uncharacterized membrane protein (UPF0136 family)
MNTSASDFPIDQTPALPRERVWPALTVGPLLAVTADFLFWRQDWGVSVGLYFCLAALTVFALRARPRRRRLPGIACGLLFIAALATVLETSLTNCVVLLALLMVIVGESAYAGVIGTAWARWSEALWGWLCAVGRWPWLFGRLAVTALVRVGLSATSAETVRRSLQAFVPAACLGLVFLVVFQAGNAVFRQICHGIYTAAMRWVENLDLSIGHLAFLLIVSTAALALVVPRAAGRQARFWTRQWQPVQRADRAVAIWQGRSILFVLNALFFAVNTIDVCYLWQKGALPAGVSYSEFVHTGVYSLIFATLLSALVLAVLFQQTAEVTHARGMKVLAYLWVAQNVVLIAGVFLRLKLYVDAYQLSALRVYVGFFLVLVMTGYGLLTWHIRHDGSLNRLIFHNVLAIFALFFVVQFLDVAGFVARFNVAQWRRDHERTLDLDYLESLGPGGWRALCSLAADEEEPMPAVVRHAKGRVARLNVSELERRGRANWRSFQFREDRAGREVIKTAWKYYAVPEPLGSER